MRKRTAAFLLLALGFDLLPAQALEKASAVYTSIGGSYAPVWVAKEKRLFEPYDLDVRLIYMRGTIPTSAGFIKKLFR